MTIYLSRFLYNRHAPAYIVFVGDKKIIGGPLQERRKKSKDIL